MTRKDTLLLRAGFIFVGTASLAGVTLLFMGRDIREPSTTFELLVFGMSSAALILAIIQSIAIERQMRAIKRSAQTLSMAVKELEHLLSTEKQQNNLLKKDMELDEALVKVLKDYKLVKK